MKHLIAAALHPRAYSWGLRPWRRHSLVLALAGCAYVAVGITYLVSRPVPSREYEDYHIFAKSAHSLG